MRTVPWYPQSRGWDAELDASIARFKYLDNKLHEMKTIPYQMCPVCYGKGFVFSLGTTNPTEACRCCNGAMIIPQYVIREEQKEYTDRGDIAQFTLTEMNDCWFNAKDGKINNFKDYLDLRYKNIKFTI